MILKLILIVLVLVIFLKQENLPSICYKLGKLIKTTQKLTNDLRDYFWSLYDMGELQSHLKIHSKVQKKKSKLHSSNNKQGENK